MFSDLDNYLFKQGTHYELYKKLGAHPLPEGGFHCYNDVDGCVFDLTSEQFGTEKLNYTSNPEQLRTTHFADPNKYARYCLLKERLLSQINAPHEHKE